MAVKGNVYLCLYASVASSQKQINREFPHLEENIQWTPFGQ